MNRTWLTFAGIIFFISILPNSIAKNFFGLNREYGDQTFSSFRANNFGDNLPDLTREVSTQSDSWIDQAIAKFKRDPAGNTLAIIILIAMIASAVGVIIVFLKDKKTFLDKLPDWLVPLLSLLGILVAAYLFFVEASRSEAVCGPIGDCNTVQQSKYAFLFGIIPIGLIGLVGYAGMVVSWLVYQFGPLTMRNLFGFFIWIMAWFGLLFSIYLTFLEPFVIGATCIWCISSAIIITLILWASTPLAVQYWQSDDSDE